MEKTIFYGKPKIYFGTGYDGPLPEGWTLIESPNDWVLAEDSKGNQYFLSDDFAYPCRIAKKAIGRLKIGERYIDTETGVVSLSNDKIHP